MTAALDRSATASHFGWDVRLARDEVIIWQGQPHGRFLWTDLRLYQSLSALVFTAVGLMLLTAEGPGFDRDAPGYVHFIFPAFGVFLILSGLYAIIGPPLKGMTIRRRSRYMLTSRAAYIQVRGRRGSLDHWPLSRDMDVSLRVPGDVIFTSVALKTDDRDFADKNVLDIGFRAIADAREVYDLMRAAIAALRPGG